MRVEIAAITLAGWLGLTGAAAGQSFNVDFGAAGSAPSASHAAAGLPGVWNNYTMLPNGSVLPLVGLDGVATNCTIRNIGGTQLLAFNNGVTAGDDEALIDDMLIGFNNPVDVCIFIDGLVPGDYEVLMYAITPDNGSLISQTRVDFANEPPAFVGGSWTGTHQEGVTFSRHTVTVGATGRIGLHSGVPSGFIQSGINGLQIRLMVPPPACPGDANGDLVVDAADLSVLLSQFGLSVSAGSGADFNGDGIVNGADLSVLLGGFGGAC